MKMWLSILFTGVVLLVLSVWAIDVGFVLGRVYLAVSLMLLVIAVFEFLDERRGGAV